MFIITRYLHKVFKRSYHVLNPVSKLCQENVTEECKFETEQAANDYLVEQEICSNQYQTIKVIPVSNFKSSRDAYPEYI